VLSWEARKLDEELAYVEANVEEIDIDLEDYRESCDQVGLRRKVMYGLVHAEFLR